MKRFLTITLCSLFLNTLLQAQELQKNIFGIREGLNISSISINKKAFWYSTSSRNSFNFGVSYQRLLVASIPFYLETGLYLSDKGFEQDIYDKYLNNEQTMTIILSDDYTTKELYLQVPLLLNYHINVNDNLRIEPFAGIYMAYGISGKTKLPYREVLYGSSPYNYVIVNSFGDGSFEKFDLGLKFGIGATFKNIYLGLAYEIGTTDIGRGYYEGNPVKNRNFSINIGYNFSSSKK